MIEQLISQKSKRNSTEVNELDFLNQLEETTPIRKKSISQGTFSTDVEFLKLYIKEFDGEKVAFTDVIINIEGKKRTLTLDRDDASKILYMFKGKFPDAKTFKGLIVSATITIKDEVFNKDGKNINFKKFEIRANISN